MGYWDRIVRSHERMSKDIPTGEVGLKAVRFIRSFFEQGGCERLHINHPLYNRLKVGFDPNYLWLVQYVRKLLTANSLTGFDWVARRLIDHREFLGAHNEIEVALKLHLEGLPVSFSGINTRPTPDLILRIGNETIRAEVSSLHPPDEETRVWKLHDHIITSSFLQGVISGGFVRKIPSLKTLNEVANQVNKAIQRVKEARIVEKLNIEGVITIYLSPRDMMDQIPEDCRGRYYLIQPHRRPIEEKIQRKIEEKSRQLFGYDEPVILFLYTQMIDRQRVYELFKREIDEIPFILATYPKLLGLVLTVPHLEIKIVSALESDSLRKEFKDNKVFLESEAGVYQYESSIIWKNPHADHSFPIDIQHALETYPSNLTNLAQIPITESY